MTTDKELELLQSIAAKSAEVRTLQKTYFKQRGYDNLNASQKAERELDELLIQYRDGIACHTEDMFGGNS